ncbi:TetR/AcrR family transcriptional regulator [Companilactobacillus sp. FL22-3]
MKDQAIIDAFIRIIMKTNYSQITIKDITREAGVSRTCFYCFFDNKESVAREAAFSFITTSLECLSISLADRNTINKQVIEIGVKPILSHKDEVRRLLSISSARYSLTNDFQKRLKLIVEKQIHSFKCMIPERRDFLANLFSSSVISGISWIVNQQDMDTKRVSSLIIEYLSNSTWKILR